MATTTSKVSSVLKKNATAAPVKKTGAVGAAIKTGVKKVGDFLLGPSRRVNAAAKKADNDARKAGTALNRQYSRSTDGGYMKK